MTLSMLAGCGGTTKPDGGEVASAETGAPDANGVPAHKEELVIGTGADINNLDLQKQQDATNNIVLKLTHETLIFFTNEGTIEPRLCTGWEFEDDTHILFKLHEGITFNDGTPLTAEDVKFTYDMGLKNELSVLKGLLEVNVIDPLTVQLVIDSYSNEFLQSLASVPVSIQSKAAYESGMDEPYLIGSGPYKLEKWEQDEYASFVKNENYWGDKKGVSEKITFRPIKEASTRAIALQNGEIDVCIDPSMDNLPDLEADGNVTVFERPGTRLFYLGFNVDQAPRDNLKLRQAVAHAIDRQSIVDVVLMGKGLTQTTVLNRGLWSFYDEMDGFPYDVEKAKALLAESGYTPDKKIPILISNESDYNQVAQLIQANFKEIGMDVEIQTVEPATLKTECINGSQGLYLWRWNEDSKVDFVFRDLFYTGSGSNYGASHLESNCKAYSAQLSVAHHCTGYTVDWYDDYCGIFLKLFGNRNSKPGSGVIREGMIVLDGDDVLQKSPKELERMRGNDVAMIFQDPMTALNPVMTIGEQIAESRAADHP